MSKDLLAAQEFGAPVGSRLYDSDETDILLVCLSVLRDLILLAHFSGGEVVIAT